MKYDEYKEKIDGLLTNPDTALAGIGEVYEALEADLTTRDSLAMENEDLKKQISDLRETNIKLYMQTTGEAEEQTGTGEDDTEEKAVEEFFNELMKGE